MSDIFQDVVLRWRGETYPVPAEDCMKLAYKVETALRQDSGGNFFELMLNPPVTGLAIAFAITLRHAKVSVTDAEVFREINPFHGGNREALDDAMSMLSQLLGSLSPPEEVAGDVAAAGERAEKDGSGKK